MRAEGDVGEIARIASTNWSKEAFTATRPSKVSIQATREFRVIMIRDGSPGDVERLQFIEKQFPGVDHKAVVEGLKVGKFVKLESMSRIRFEAEDVEDNTPKPADRALWIMKLREFPATGPLDDREVVVAMKKILGEAHQSERTEIMLQFPETDDPATIRKIAEACTPSEDTKIELCMRGRRKNGRPEEKEAKLGGQSQETTKQKKEKKPKKEDEAEIIVVRPSEGRTFTEVAKILKEQVSPNEERVPMQVSKSRGAEVVLRVEGNTRGAVSMLSEKLKTKEQEIGAEVHRVTKVITLAIRGLDATVEASEVRAAMKKEGVKEEDISTLHLPELRTDWTGSRTAFVRLPRGLGKRLLQMRILRVGWAGCQARVTEFEQETCCYRCQKFGHVTWEGKEPADTQRKCYRCGGADHIAKSCCAATRCYGCGDEGHRADSIKCPSRGERQAEAERAAKPDAQKRRRRRARELEDSKETDAGNREYHPDGGQQLNAEEEGMMQVEVAEGQDRNNRNDSSAPNEHQ